MVGGTPFSVMTSDPAGGRLVINEPEAQARAARSFGFQNPWFAAEAGKSTGGSPLDNQSWRSRSGSSTWVAVQRIDGTQCADKPIYAGKVDTEVSFIRANTWPLLSPPLWEK